MRLLQEIARGRLTGDEPLVGAAIGVGMTVSVFTGYLTSILVVPSLCDMFVKEHRREARS